jgi:putative membrane protein
MVRALLIRWSVLTVAVWVTTAVLSGIDVNGGLGTYLLVAIVLGTVNAVLGSILRLLTFPLILLSLGLFSLIISALMLEVTDWLMDSFEVDGFGPAFVGAVIIAVVTMVLDLVFLPERRRRARARG